MAVVFTGGSGLLGTEMRRVFPDAYYPPHDSFDVTKLEHVECYLENTDIDIVIHAAAFTSPPAVEENPIEGIKTNIVGTSNVVMACQKRNIKLIYISTDYVFRGDEELHEGYEEDDAVHPVNKYAWTKLGGECAVRCYDNSLIVRTSFGEDEFPYPKAFVDQYTGRITVSEFAKELIDIIGMDITGVLHVGHPHVRSVYEYATDISPDKEIGEIRRCDVSTPVPHNTYLDTRKFEELKEGRK